MATAIGLVRVNGEVVSHYDARGWNPGNQPDVYMLGYGRYVWRDGDSWFLHVPGQPQRAVSVERRS